MKRYSLLIVMLFLLGFMIEAQEETQPKGKFVGEVFGDYFYKTGGDTIFEGSGQFQKTAKDDNAFIFRRIYFGYEYSFNEKFSAKLLLEGSDDELLANDKRGVSLKNAYLKWKEIYTGASLLIGAQSTPTYAITADKIWGYRSVERNIMDMRKKGASSDLGILLTGKFDNEGLFNYTAMIGNGTAQKVENDNYRRYYGSVNANLLDKRLFVEIYGDFQRGNEADYGSLKGYVAWQTDAITIGLEPFMQQEVDTLLTEDPVSVGTTFFGRGTIIKDKLNIFGRIDLYDPDVNDDQSGWKEMFIVLGMDYMPIKNVNIIPNIWINSYSEKSTEVERTADVVTRLTVCFKI